MYYTQTAERNVQLIIGHYTSEAPPQTDEHVNEWAAFAGPQRS
jgi:hypothetical protein